MEEEEEEERDVEEVWSWGAGSDGQLGTGSFDDQHLPQLLSFPPRGAASAALRISQIACGGAHSIALTAGSPLSYSLSFHWKISNPRFTISEFSRKGHYK